MLKSLRTAGDQGDGLSLSSTMPAGPLSKRLEEHVMNVFILFAGSGPLVILTPPTSIKDSRAAA